MGRWGAKIRRACGWFSLPWVAFSQPSPYIPPMRTNYDWRDFVYDLKSRTYFFLVEAVFVELALAIQAALYSLYKAHIRGRNLFQRSKDIGRVCFLLVAWIPHYIFEIISLILLCIAAGMGYVASLMPRKGLVGLIAIALLWIAIPFGVASEASSKFANFVWTPQKLNRALKKVGIRLLGRSQA